METKKSLKSRLFFVCKNCDYITSRKTDLAKHLTTSKHTRMVTEETEETNKSLKVADVISCKKCGNIYITRAGLWKHSKICDHIVSCAPETENVTLTIESLNKDEIIMKLMDLCKEQTKQIANLIPKIGNTNITNNSSSKNIVNNTNNNFNLSVFLNEQCKDALNISEFIASLKITLEDLAFSRTNGLVGGITDVMIRGLNQLDIHKRPIHCTDTKRNTMYIKDNEKWKKDDNHVKMKETIIKIANKERNAINSWVAVNPNWIDTEEKQMEYLHIINKVCEPIENYENYEKKIIRNIGKEIILNKNTEKQLKLI